MVSDEGFYRSLAEASPNGVLLVALDGRIEFANPRAASLIGAQSQSDLVGRYVTTFLRDADRRRASDDYATLKADDVIRACDCRLRRVDSGTVDANISASTIRNGDGTSRGYAVIVVD